MLIRWLLWSSILFLLCVTERPALAATVINTASNPPWDGVQRAETFGFPNTATYGQVVTVPATDSVLESFSFMVDLPANALFRGYVYEWNDATNRATGAPRFESGPRNSAGRGFQSINFTPPNGGVALRPGSKVVLFLSTARDQSSGAGALGFTGDSYSGGKFVFLNNVADAAQWTLSPWQDYRFPANSDLAFTATFKSPPDSTAGVSLSPDGIGQVLIYPYYTVRHINGNQYNNYFSVVNTTALGKAIKVHIREGKNGRPVLSFNMYLAPLDSWTGAIVPSTEGAKLITSDASCTSPRVPQEGIQFTNAAYSDGNADGESTDLDRTSEGWIELIEMGVIENPTLLAAISSRAAPAPPNCLALTDSLARANVLAGNGGLFGSQSLINVTAAFDIAVEVVALADFNLNASLWTPAGDALPNLTSVSPKRSVIGPLISSWTGPNSRPSDPVSALFMREQIYNEFFLENGNNSLTAWVLTFPTKYDYVTTGFAARPFNSTFGLGGACETIQGLMISDRDGRFAPATTPPSLCWHSGAVKIFNGVADDLLGSANAIDIDLAGSGVASGWMGFRFTGATVTNTPRSMTDDSGRRYFGLPVIGFRAQLLSSGTVAGLAGSPVLSIYGSGFSHKGSRRIQAP